MNQKRISCSSASAAFYSAMFWSSNSQLYGLHVRNCKRTAANSTPWSFLSLYASYVALLTVPGDLNSSRSVGVWFLINLRSFFQLHIKLLFSWTSFFFLGLFLNQQNLTPANTFKFGHMCSCSSHKLCNMVNLQACIFFLLVVSQQFISPYIWHYHDPFGSNTN